MKRLLEEKFVTTPQGQIFYYTDLSFPGKRTVVFLHGLSSNHTTWINVIQKIHEAGYNSIALDLRGHGKSDKRKRYANYKFPVFSEDLKQILERENLGQVIVVGYSFGGSIALDFISRFPHQVTGLMLISTNSVCPLKYRHLILLKYPIALLYHIGAILLLWQRRRQDIYFQHGQSRGYWHSFWIGLNTMPLSINFWMFIQAGVVDFRKILPGIVAPTIILRAQADPFLTQKEAQDMQRMIPNSRLMVSENPKHFLATHAQGEITEIILDFLNQCV